jgi:hypothetical protein|eukprot:COSAG06_NODE_363_length_16808_cov_11.122509_13_plen_45_part_00
MRALLHRFKPLQLHGIANAPLRHCVSRSASGRIATAVLGTVRVL